MTANIEMFNQVVALIFDHLYRQFPVADTLDYDGMAAKLGVDAADHKDPPMIFTLRTRDYGKLLDGVDFEEFVDSAAAFLAAEGFLQKPGPNAYRLSARALLILDAPIAGLDKSLGAKLTGAVKEAGTEAGRSVVSEIVGQIIGAAVKGAMGAL